MKALFDNGPMHLTCKISYFQTSNPANPFKRSNNYNIKSQKLSIEHLDNNDLYYLYDLTYFV
jgi:hypothetical protein